MFFKICIVFAVLIVNLQICQSDDLNLGNPRNTKLYYNETIQLPAIPRVVRSEIVDIIPRKKIQAIKAIDLNKSEAKPNITEGGLGFRFVFIKLKSDLGKSLNYRVEVYI